MNGVVNKISNARLSKVDIEALQFELTLILLWKNTA